MKLRIPQQFDTAKACFVTEAVVAKTDNTLGYSENGKRRSARIF
jgi:hypothetical protein